MNAVAGEAKMPAASVDRIEQDLLSALATREASDASPSNGMKHATSGSPLSRRQITVSSRAWLRVAAAIVLVGCGVLGWRLNRPLVTIERLAAPPRSSAVSPGVPSPTQILGTDARPSTVAPQRVRHAPIQKKARDAAVVTPAGFVALPWTAGLPAFESGEIVRMEVPVASLSAYGIDISPATASRPVEADLLIGQ